MIIPVPSRSYYFFLLLVVELHQRNATGFSPIVSSTTLSPRSNQGNDGYSSSPKRRNVGLRSLDVDGDDDDFVRETEPDPSFDDLGLTSTILASVQSQGWEHPTPVQRAAIPAIFEMCDVDDSLEAGVRSENVISGEENPSNMIPPLSLWVEAPTGSGKTAAFGLPLLQLAMQCKNDQTGVDVSTLVLCPTRELAIQIGGVLEELAEGMISSSRSSQGGGDGVSVEIIVVTGGVPVEPQIEKLAQRKRQGKTIDIIVATPGRLVDVMLNAEKENPQEKELEKRLLAALDGISRSDASLSLNQINELKLNEFMESGDDGGRSAIKDILSGVRYLVLDEADRLLSQGFKTEMDAILKLLPRPTLLNKIDAEGSNSRRLPRMKTFLFSATFPQQIQQRVEAVLRVLSGKDSPPPIRLSCALAAFASPQPKTDDEELSGRQRKRLEQTTQPTMILDGSQSTIDLRVIRIEEKDRTQALRKLLKQYGNNEWDRVLVFVATRYASEHVAMKLRRANIVARELHGKLDQDARNRRLNDFKKGKTRVLVATDLASRGLDVVGLPAVVNYDLPRSTADFVHRVGRTGRAGNRGSAVSFVTPNNEAQFDLIEKRHFNGKMGVEKEVLKGFEPNEERWNLETVAATLQVTGVKHSNEGLAHDKMFGGIKGRRRSKKDKVREKAALDATDKQ